MRTAWQTALTLVFLMSPVCAQDFSDLFDVRSIQSPDAQGAEAEASVSALLKPTDKADVVEFELSLTLSEGANTYSMDKEFATQPTTISLSGLEGWQPLDPGFSISPKPKKKFDDIFMKEVEKVTGTTVFTKRFQAPPEFDVKSAKFTGTIDFLLCDDKSCVPQSREFAAAFLNDPQTAPVETPPLLDLLAPPPSAVDIPLLDDSPTRASSTGIVLGDFAFGYQLVPQRRQLGSFEDDPVSLQFKFSPENAKTGEEVTLSIRMQLSDQWHTYGLEKRDDQVELPTKIKLLEVAGLEAIGQFASSPEPTAVKSEFGTSNVHSEEVTWSQKFRVINAEKMGIAGTISYQICKELCLPPIPVAFSLGSLQNSEDIARATPIIEQPSQETSPPSPMRGIAENVPEASPPDASHESSSKTPEDSAETPLDLFEVETVGKIDSLAWAIPFAFLGGLLLNIMPCVLPVLAIKILSLVQQAGESRFRVLSLNLSYTAGVMSVFLVLAVVAAALGWGAQFQSSGFVILMALVVFAMGLSLLGVYDLPVPGLVPSSNHHQEGLLGAFNTGIIATLLATPCTGPFMGPVIFYAGTQPLAINFLIFGTMGLGMASPYVIAGFFPNIVNLLPKPGMWMVRFKQFSGFVLLGTVIWLMQTTMSPASHIPMLILLLGTALLLWMIGQAHASGQRLLGAPLVKALLISAPVIAFAVYSIISVQSQPASNEVVIESPDVPADDVDQMPWERFSEARMAELRAQGKPMLIDFTADWCLVCKQNERFSLNRKATVEFVREHGVVPMVADYTDFDPEIKKWIEKFGAKSVPLTVVFPADLKQKAVAISGPFSMTYIVEQLEAAVKPTQTAASETDKRLGSL